MKRLLWLGALQLFLPLVMHADDCARDWRRAED
jgi:hypothetical protein